MSVSPTGHRNLKQASFNVSQPNTVDGDHICVAESHISPECSRAYINTEFVIMSLKCSVCESNWTFVWLRNLKQASFNVSPPNTGLSGDHICVAESHISPECSRAYINTEFVIMSLKCSVCESNWTQKFETGLIQCISTKYG